MALSANLSNSFFERIRLDGSPTANHANEVICGHARFTILTSRLIRLEWTAGTYFEDRATFAFPARAGEIVGCTMETDGPHLDIKTQYLHLHFTDDGQPFNAHNLSIRLTVDGEQVTWTPGMANDGNLRATCRTLDQCAAATRLEPGPLSRDGWAIMDDSATPVWTDDGKWVEGRDEDHLYDWYFFGYGHDYKAALHEYIQFGGPIPLVPRYVLGGWWSRFWAYSADDLKALVGEFRDHDVPLDVLVVDMDWHTPLGWTGYSWNRDLFPNPEAFLAWAHEQGLAVTLNLHPADGIVQGEDAYPKFAELMGHDTSTGATIKFNCTDPNFIQNYFEVLHHPMEEQGIDFWWLDWQQGESTDIRNLDPLGWLNHLHFRDAARRGKRPMLYSRWGGLGNHRYPIGFSGDTYATWESLAFQPYFTATAANVIYGWWSHDIGGHFGATEPELYARWVQFGALSPALRLHSTKEAVAERRPWGFAEPVYEAAKAAFQFRYKMLPYLYSAAHETAQVGLSLCYPMYYEYPNADDAYLAHGQYFLGNQLIAAPIVSPADPATGVAGVDVWVPEGTWIEFTTLEVFNGPKWVRLQGDLTYMPMLVRAGAVIPMAPKINRTAEFDGSHVILTVFPGEKGAFSLYEDDGATEGYQRGEYETTTIRTAAYDHTLVANIDPAQGTCAVLPAQRTIELHVRGTSKPVAVTVNGAPQANWTHEDGDLVLILENMDRRMPIEIAVQTQDSVKDSVSRSSAEPFAHIIDNSLYDDARRELGTIVIAPAGDGSPCEVDVEWAYQAHAAHDAHDEPHKEPTTIVPIRLMNVTERHILHCPFSDDGALIPFAWRATITIRWQGTVRQFAYSSPQAYPSVNQWQAVIANRDEKPLTIENVLVNGDLNQVLGWETVTQKPELMQNINQPYGVVLLENERQRLIDKESLNAALSTIVECEAAGEVVIAVQCFGEHSAYLNGEKLTAGSPIRHAKLQPMFYSWMPPKVVYYTVRVKAGVNRLILITEPGKDAQWWGIGATVYDAAGKVMAAGSRVEAVAR